MMELFVFTTSRMRKNFVVDYAKKNPNSFLPKIFNLDDFFKRAIFVKNVSLASYDTRRLLLQKASDFEGFLQLGIARDFLRFLHSSDFFLRFFDELFTEKKHIETLQLADTYQDYEEHLIIASKLLQNYQELLKKHKLFDKTMLDLYELNEEFLHKFKKIEIFFQGYLSAFEKELYEKIASTTDLILHINITKYDDKLRNIFGFDLDLGYDYALDLTNKTIIGKTALNKIEHIELFTAKNVMDEIKLLFREVFLALHEGISAEKIAVVCANEELTSTIQTFDDNRIFNFARGKSFSNTRVFRFLNALFLYAKEENEFNQKRLESFKDFSHNLRAKNHAQFLDELGKNLPPQQARIFSHELKRLRHLTKSHELDFYAQLGLFLHMLKKRYLDDVGGGKITVLGALETRASAFDCVIVLDFSDLYVPKQNVKDIFINTRVRTLSDMPSIEDRQNYHRSLYYNLFANSKRSCIISCDNEEESPSNFIYSMNLPTITPPRDVFVPFFTQKSHNVQHDDIVLDIDLTSSPLSATKLKTYLTCKRAFYYKYVKKIQNEQEVALGSIIHAYLETLYRGKTQILDLKELKQAWNKQLQQETDIRTRFEMMVWTKKLDGFFHEQIRRFQNGYEIYALEATKTIFYKNVHLKGKIDRIDKHSDGYEIIDYKSGKIKTQNAKNIAQTADFQLAFYYLLCKDELHITDLINYELDGAKTHKEKFLAQKLELLDTHLAAFSQTKQNFSQTKDEKNCRFCPFVYLCLKI